MGASAAAVPSTTATTASMSAFYIRKLKTYFAATDTDKDGVLTANDYHEMAKRFIDLAKVSPTDAPRIYDLAQKVGPIVSLNKFTFPKLTQSIFLFL